jgi:hypothetical protein
MIPKNNPGISLNNIKMIINVFPFIFTGIKKHNNIMSLLGAKYTIKEINPKIAPVANPINTALSRVIGKENIKRYRIKT